MKVSVFVLIAVVPILLTGCQQEPPKPPPTSVQKNLKEVGKKLDEFEQQQNEADATDAPITQQDWQRWHTQWINALRACEGQNGTVEPLVVGTPATQDEIDLLEQELETKLPVSLRYVLTTFSGDLHMSWELVDEVDRPEPIREIFYGGMEWNLEEIREAELARRDWPKNSTSDSDAESDRYHKLGFLTVTDGDVIAFDLEGGDDPPVVYLSREAGEFHEYRLGDNFIDFVNRWSQLGCPRIDKWQMSPFVSTPTSGLDTDSEKSKQWRTWFGLE